MRVTSVSALGLIAGLTLTVTTASTMHAQAQTARPSKQYTIEQFMNTTSVSGASFSADEIAHPVLVEQDRHLQRLLGARRAAATPTAVTTSTTDSTYAVSLLPATTTASSSRATRAATS